MEDGSLDKDGQRAVVVGSGGEMPDFASIALSNLSRERLTQTLTEIIDIPSGQGNEAQLAMYLSEKFRRMGLRTRLQPIEEGRANVIGRLAGEGKGASLLLFGHLDTVWSGAEEVIRDMGPGFQPRATIVKEDNDEWVYGIGAYNMKSGLACVVETVQSICEASASSGRRLCGDLIVAGVAGEIERLQVDDMAGPAYRGLSLGSYHLITSGGVATDFAVMAEPTAGFVSSIAGGFVYCRVSSYAHPGASYIRSRESTVDLAPDAIELMLPLLMSFGKWRDAFRSRHTYRGEPAGNAVIVAVRGGFPTLPGKRAPFCRAYIGLYFMAGERELDLVDELREFIRSCESPCVTFDLEVIARIPGTVVADDEYGVQLLLRAHQQIHGTPTRTTADARYTDAVVLTRYGIPTVCYGPQGRLRSGGLNYYSADGEHCSINDLLLGTQVLISFAVGFCSADKLAVRRGGVRSIPGPG